MKTMKNYHDLYLKFDVLLLTDEFEIMNYAQVIAIICAHEV